MLLAYIIKIILITYLLNCCIILFLQRSWRRSLADYVTDERQLQGQQNMARQYQTGVPRPGYCKIVLNTNLLSDHATRHAPCKDTISPKLASILCHLTPLKNRHKFQIFNAISRYLRSHILSCRIPLPHQQSLINHVARHISSSRLLQR